MSTSALIVVTRFLVRAYGVTLARCIANFEEGGSVDNRKEELVIDYPGGPFFAPSYNTRGQDLPSNRGARELTDRIIPA